MSWWMHLSLSFRERESIIVCFSYTALIFSVRRWRGFQFSTSILMPSVLRDTRHCSMCLGSLEQKKLIRGMRWCCCVWHTRLQVADGEDCDAHPPRFRCGNFWGMQTMDLWSRGSWSGGECDRNSLHIAHLEYYQMLVTLPISECPLLSLSEFHHCILYYELASLSRAFHHCTL